MITRNIAERMMTGALAAQRVGRGAPSGLDLAEPPEWVVDALCAQTDPEEFFPEKGGSTRQAKRVCMSCDVRTECLDYALERGERFGIWGGLSERERRKLRGEAGARPGGQPDPAGDRRAAELAEAGMTVPEIAKALGVTPRSAERKLARHRARAAQVAS